ncbi:dnaj molecular chaperone homology domain [Caudoviricetes sp.]|nr:dnaj molecular chaperone homology domain [Caudoviricetes sp.]
MKEIISAIEILGLDEEITPLNTRRKYKALAKEYHPDVNPDGIEMMKKINHAYDMIKDLTAFKSQLMSDYSSMAKQNTNVNSRVYPFHYGASTFGKSSGWGASSTVVFRFSRGSWF